MATADAVLTGAAVGVDIGPLASRVDARWLMAFAAALGETHPRYFDTAAGEGPAAHPLFSVCYEWPALVAVREKVVPTGLAARAVHASHRIVLHRPPRAGETLLTSARVTRVEPRPAGTLLVVELATVDAGGGPVTTTEHGSIFRGVATDVPAAPRRRAGTDGSPSPPPGGAGTNPSAGPDEIAAPSAASAAGAGTAGWTETIPIAAGAAHVYSECARIWNPIHTDIAAARAAGLPGLILHGTATLALAVSRIVARELGGDPARVREVGVRFSGMVRLPSCLSVHAERDAGVIRFRATDPAGAVVLSEGVVTP
ncbi:MAG TPA: MaoC family dehydratase N-terminal domain-containing protein [Methylomirabilota bacterium]|jgi:acyl dehydratase